MHYFGGEYLFEASMKIIPFGKIMSNLTDKFEEGLDLDLNLSEFLDDIVLEDNVFRFKNFSNIYIESSCEIGQCQISIENGKSYSNFSLKEGFRF